VIATDFGTPPQQVTQTLSIVIDSADTSHNSLLKGRYAFVATGFRPLSPRFLPVSIQIATGGSFVADGKGNVTDAVIDSISPNGIATNQAVAGIYVLGSDNRGILGFDTPAGTVSLPFSVGSIECGGVATKGRVITPFGEAGELDLQDPAELAGSSLGGAYAFGVAGSELTRAFGVNGAIVLDGGGTVTGRVDTTQVTTFVPDQAVTGTYGMSAGQSVGRGTAMLHTPSMTLNMTFYVVSSDRLLILGTEQGGKFFAFAGQARRQAGLPFDLASLRGTSVLGAGKARGGVATGGLATFDGAGAVSFLLDQHDAGKIALGAASSGSYVISANGHVMFSGADTVASSLYLVSPGEGFLLYGDSRTGYLEKQALGPFDDSSIEGSYFVGNSPSTSPLGVSGVASASGRALRESMDLGRFGVPFRHLDAMESFSVAPNGRATTGSGLTVMYIVSPKKFAAIDVNPVDFSNIIFAER